MSREKQILKKIEQGDLSHLDELVERYYPDIFRYCLWHTKDPQTAEDAVQETFLKFIRHFSGMAHNKKLKAYIYKIASNVCTDLWRKKTADELPENMLYVDSGYEEAEADTDFIQMVNRLPAEQREIVILRFSQDLTIRDIAQVTNLPLRTVQSRLRSALKKMKKAYQEGGVENEEGF